MTRARAAALAAPLLLAFALSGCETTAEKSAKLQHEAKRVRLAQQGLSITRESSAVKVVSATVISGPESAAAIVLLRNHSSRTLSSVPLEITVANARGQTVFQNDAPGLEGALVSVPSIGPHRTVAWVNDQLPAKGKPASVTARVGEAPSVAGSPPLLTISGTSLREDPANGVDASGSVENRSTIAQRNLVIFALARRGSRVVAAGRAIIPTLASGESKSFQVFFVGNAQGAKLQVSAPPTTFR